MFSAGNCHKSFQLYVLLLAKLPWNRTSYRFR